MTCGKRIDTGANSTDWYFGSELSGIGANQADFLSVAIHEIAHVMGFGTSTNWQNLVSGTDFIGTKSTEIYGNPVPLDGGHWDDSVTIDGRETAMDTTLSDGTRQLLTRLDYAGLEDIGWQVDSAVYATPVPFKFSPSLGLFFVAGMFGTKKVWNTWRSKK